MKNSVLLLCAFIMMVVAGSVSAADKNVEEVKVMRIDSPPQMMGGAAVDMPVNGGCQAGNTIAAYWIDGWLSGDEIFSVFADPSVCGCAANLVTPSSVAIALYAEEGVDLCSQLTMQADIRAVDWNGGLCPRPSDNILCQSPIYGVTLPGAGAYIVNLPIGPCTPVSGPFFASVSFIGAVCPEVNTVIDDVPVSCNSYNDWGGGWVDLVDTAGFPGGVTLYANVECAPYLEATIDIDPNTLNLKSSGKYVTCYIELPAGDPAEIDVSTILLNGAIPAEPAPTAIGDYDSDGMPDLMVKFDRGVLIASLGAPGVAMWLREKGSGNVPLAGAGTQEMVVTGELLDGTPFMGSDDIRIINPGGGNEDAGAGGEAVFEVYPTPVAGTARISYELGVPGQVNLRVFDAAGRMVRILEVGHKSAGKHHVTWDRKTDSGQLVGPGVYFIKLERQEGVSTQKLLVVK